MKSSSPMRSIFQWAFLFVLLVSSCTSREARSQSDVVKEDDRPPMIDSVRLNYPWKENYDVINKLINRIPVPEGYSRIELEPGSFAEWLRNAPLKEGRPDVLLYDGSKKWNQRAHHLVLDIDVGNRDLQQCADAVMRLRGEYLYAVANWNDLHFNYTSGFRCDFKRWSAGDRPSVNGNNVKWVKTGTPGSNYSTFRKYMENIFNYCGTYSLAQELKLTSLETIKPGDVFIKGGFPGHAVIVMDVAVNSSSGERLFLLAQSYMPAQDIHILRNPNDDALTPWYSNRIPDALRTPEWTFEKNSVKQFQDSILRSE